MVGTMTAAATLAWVPAASPASITESEKPITA